MQILRVILCYQNRWFCHNLICFQMRQFSPTSLENFLMGRIWTKYGYVQTEMFWIPFDYYHYVVIGLLRSLLQVISSCERQSWSEGVCDHSRFWLSCLGPIRYFDLKDFKIISKLFGLSNRVTLSSLDKRYSRKASCARTKFNIYVFSTLIRIRWICFLWQL